MGWPCEYCKRELNKGDRFILNGQYPDGWDRLSKRFWLVPADDLGDYGAIYHEECFYEALNKNRYRR